jgi:hypothetical protein
MSLLDRLKKGKTKTVNIPDSEEKVHIRTLSVKELDAYIKAVQVPDADQVRLLLELLILAVTDENGKPQWTADDYESLRELPLKVIKHVAEEIAMFSGVAETKNA